ncbi:T9SS type A sorting domain-containing protein [Aureivirga marina]|uniref:T9SS type A sorting domain-containing protein n=1 Tax=Aureivirga marina TaxID=1182451 RepID=UPI0018CB8883|nr:T9SS type A sorting domain-containing protein [Aureivirga marina]
MKKLLVLFLFVLITNNLVAQYDVKSINYVEYFGDENVQFNSDDKFSDDIPLPFDFNFYGTDFNEVMVGTNGRVSFYTSLSGFFSHWKIEVNYTLPNVSSTFGIANTIYGLYHDMDNFTTDEPGAITTAVFGEAPFRKFIVTYDDIPHFHHNCTEIKSTFQVILFEGLNFIDVHIKNKGVCSEWNDGRAIIGIQDEEGINYSSPEGRNNFIEELEEESWRFIYYNGTYEAFICGNSATTISLEDFQSLTSVYQLNDTEFYVYTSEADALANTNPIAFPFEIMYPLQELFVNVNGSVFNVMINSVDCSNLDNDDDGLSAEEEDLNGNGILSDDDTDNDGIPNFLDSDDDNDYILTNQELVFPEGITTTEVTILDTDNDGIPNHIDTDDDNDGIPTMHEDVNGNGNYEDDDEDEDGIPNYLDNNALNIENVTISNHRIFPNPFKDKLFLNQSFENATIKIINTDGQIILEKRINNSVSSINTEKLPTGIYQIILITDKETESYKMLKIK